MVSNEGGIGPIWSRNGRELFYQSFDHRIDVAEYTVRGGSFVVEKARDGSQTRLPDTGFSRLRRCAGREAGGGDARCRGLQGRDAGAADAQRGCRTESPCAGVPRYVPLPVQI